MRRHLAFDLLPPLPDLFSHAPMIDGPSRGTSLMMMMSRRGGGRLGVARPSPTTTHTLSARPPGINFPMTLLNNYSTQERRPGQTQICIINTFSGNKKRRSKDVKAGCKHRPPACPPTHPSPPVSVNWESMAEPHILPTRTTDKDTPGQ